MDPVTEHLNRLLSQESTPLWTGYVNMLKTLQSVFMSSEQWVLEFLQNAEDARAEKFSIAVDDEGISIRNSGRPFEDQDFFALCDINSRKLPSKGFRGYIGIGFKSIFTVSDRVDITSGEYSFRFDRSFWLEELARTGKHIRRWPWEILPIKTEPMVTQHPYRTCFRVHATSDRTRATIAEVEEFLEQRFPLEAILLLQRVKEVEVITRHRHCVYRKTLFDHWEAPAGANSSADVVSVAEDTGDDKSRTVRYLVCRNVVDVPVGVRNDPETERVRRNDIESREIGLVFTLNQEDDIEPASGRFSSVSSFTPVQGEQTGLPFGIFGDFIPQLGRDLVNYSAAWNQWICSELQCLFKDVTRSLLLSHPRWKFSPTVFLTKIRRMTDEGAKRLWWPFLNSSIEAFLESEALYLDRDNQARRLAELAHPDDQVQSLVDNLQGVMSGIPKGMYRPHELLEPALKKSGKINCIYCAEFLKKQVFSNSTVLEQLKSEPEKLAMLYRFLPKKDYEYYRRQFVLGEDGRYYQPSSLVAVSIDLQSLPGFLRLVIEEESLKPLQLQVAHDTEATRALMSYGLKVVDLRTVVSRVRATIERVHGQADCPGWAYPEDVIEASLFLIANTRNDQGESWMSFSRLFGDDLAWHAGSNLYMAGAPVELAWSLVKEHLKEYQPVSHLYLEAERLSRYGLTLSDVLGTFARSGVHGFHQESDRELVEQVGYSVAEAALCKEGHKVVYVKDRDKEGYDLKCDGHCSKVFEVKGMLKAVDVSLGKSERERAEEKGRDYVLICVYDLLQGIKYKMISDPQRIWRPVDSAKVPREKWLSAT